MVVNTTLDESVAEKINYLSKTTDLTISEILKNAIDIYYEHIRLSPADRLKAFYDAGFIGGAEGDAHLSTNYKSELTAILENKHDHG